MINRQFQILLFFLAHLFLMGPLGAQNTYTSRRLSDKPPVVDGDASDFAWSQVDWASGFKQRDPYEGRDPSQQTAFKILYDDNNLYILVRAYDNQPDSIVRRMTRKDDIDGDFVEVLIDSYYDKRTAFGFAVSAAGVKMDEAITDDSNFDGTWDPVWFVKTGVDKEGWTAEMRIPLSQLRFGKQDSYTWGLQVLRKLFRKKELSVWDPMPREKGLWVNEFGTLTGIKDIKPKKDIEIVPYSVARTERFQKEPGNPFENGKKSHLDGGVDGKIAVTNDFTLNFTVNPDFGQVEADPSEVNLTAFESYFQEQRPFFVEGKNIYEYKVTMGDGGLSRDNLFYSRRVGRRPHRYPDVGDNEFISIPGETNILGAFKLSGKTKNGLSVGILESFTDNETADIGNRDSTRSEIVEPFTNYFVARAMQDFDSGNVIVGGIFTATNRDLDQFLEKEIVKSAYSGGLNYTNYFKNKQYELNFRGIYSQVNASKEVITDLQESSARYFQRPDKTYTKLDSTRTSLAGHGGTISFSKNGGGHWQYMSWLTWRSPSLELNDIGYLHHADEVQHILWAAYQIREPFSIFRFLSINSNEYSGWNFGGEKLYLGGNISVNAQFKNYWSGGLGMNRDGKNLGTSALRGGPALKLPGGSSYWCFVSTDSRKKLLFEINVNQYFGDLGYFRNTFVSLGIAYRPSNAITISLIPQYSRSTDETQYVTEIDGLSTPRYILSDIKMDILSASLRINYSITPDLSLQYWGQPFLFAGKYSNFKSVVSPKSDKYEDRFHLFQGQEILYDAENNQYFVDENQDGVNDYVIDNPNFNFFEFRSNFVLRWEFVPGSTFFFVWSQGRTNDDTDGRFRPRHDMDLLFNTTPHNVGLLKLAYRFVF
jgi:hypothetical protein